MRIDLVVEADRIGNFADVANQSAAASEQQDGPLAKCILWRSATSIGFMCHSREGEMTWLFEGGSMA